MIEISQNAEKIRLLTGDKKEVLFDTQTLQMLLDGYDVTYPGEYEKSSILLEVKEYEQKLFYNFLIEEKNIVVIPYDNFSLEEEILSFFGDVDILIIRGTKEAAKIFENVESKVVIPYGESKDLFLHTLGQHVPEVGSYKVKWEFDPEMTEFVNLA